MAERGSYAKGRAKRDEIVDVALDLFARTGYDRTSVREIARLTGLSQAGLLHHFKSKEEIFLEVLRRRDDRNEQHYDANQGHPVSLPGLVEIVRHNTEEPGLVRLYVTMSAESTADDSNARQFFKARYERLIGDVAKDIAERQEAGTLHAGLDPAGLASLVIAAADGLQIQWLLEPDTFDMGERLAMLTTILAELAPATTD
jgi:AcrR family transcriptional regulator